MRFATAAAALAALAAPSYAAIAADKVTALPGWSGNLLSTMYSGYLNIPGGKHLHYIFIESTATPAATANVQLWLNGGPGCSSMEGLFNENGPYALPENNGRVLNPNPFTWNNQTNMLYIESPAGVGFSYADTPDGLNHNDSSTATDALAGLLYFFKGFPEFAANEFYISGESYAGIYVPTLAHAVVQHNNANPQSRINLKGILVGNGCLGNEVGICGNDYFANSFDIDQWYGHGLISPATYHETLAKCGNFNNENPSCDAMLMAASLEVGHIDIYNIYGPCISSGATTSGNYSAAAPYLKRPMRPLERRLGRLQGLTGPDACIDAGSLTEYLNQPAAISALHVVTGIPWVICTGNISYTPTEPDERRVIYPTILNAGVRVLIYNGEADACVPWQDNYWWTSSMNITVLEDWHSWMVTPDWVGGYAVNYDRNFTFVTVRGAGHMVPETQPAAAWTMWNNFITNTPF